MAKSIYAGDGGYFKTCTKCEETKPISGFSTDPRWGDGYCTACKSCKALSARSWAKNNPEKVKARHKRENMSPEEYDSRVSARAQYYKENPAYAEKARERARAYYLKYREKVLSRMSSPEGRDYSRKKMRDKREDDSFRLHSNLSRAIRASIKDKLRRRWEILVGYSLDDLTLHLERQFLPGMSWENYGRGAGKWHIDHIIPRTLHSYERADDADFKACWALSNLRPLWSEENISKHAKRLYLL